MNLKTLPNFVILVILDGWGIAKEGPGNAIKLASTHNINRLLLSYPHCELEASGEAVGLPYGEDGNTETGHLNIGAGKIVYQNLKRIDISIDNGSFYKNKIFLKAIDHAIKYQSNLHLMGLIGSGGVHSNNKHLIALIKLASQNRFKRLYLHLFTDGRDSPPTSAKNFIKEIESVIEYEKTGKIASIMGRYWAMDRDYRWERTRKAYEALTLGKANIFNNPYETIDYFYKNGITDEFIQPCIFTDKNNINNQLIKDNDSVIFYNFRIDRPRQLTKAFIMKDFSKADIFLDSEIYHEKYLSESKHSNQKYKEPFPRRNKLKNLLFVTMTQYSKALENEGAITAFPPEIISNPLSKVISNAGLRQLKITESEKERFVTFYFNGLRDIPYALEERIIIPSPKVSTYDQEPEMRAYDITQTVINKLKKDNYNFILINYPNADMVGHTGNIGATVKAIEVLDECIEKLSEFVLAYQGLMIITADHGNAEEIINEKTGNIDTEHSINKVPFIVVSQEFKGISKRLKDAILADIAPTILSIMNLKIPKNMTGKNLLSEDL